MFCVNSAEDFQFYSVLQNISQEPYLFRGRFSKFHVSSREDFQSFRLQEDLERILKFRVNSMEEFQSFM